MIDAKPILPRFFRLHRTVAHASQSSAALIDTICVLHVCDERLLRFAAAVVGLGTLGTSPQAVRVQRGLPIGRHDIAAPYSVRPAITLTISTAPRQPPTPIIDAVPTLTREGLWLADAVLRHPHAWNLIRAAPKLRTRSLMLSLANSGIARVVRDTDWLAMCLTALRDPSQPEDWEEVRRIIMAARMKQGGYALHRELHYQPGRVGPVPLGHASTGHFVLHDRRRQRTAKADANQIMSPQYLEQLAPREFWMDQFAWQGRLNAGWAGETLMEACLQAGRYEGESPRGARMGGT